MLTVPEAANHSQIVKGGVLAAGVVITLCSVYIILQLNEFISANQFHDIEADDN